MLLKGLSLLFLGIGIFVLMQVVLPFASFKMLEISAYEETSTLIDPTEISEENVSIENIGDFPAFMVKGGSKGRLPYKEFKLSIPSLSIDQIKVLSSSNDFEKTLAQLPGSAFPGEKGNVFITGHSSLPIGGSKYAYFVDLPNIKKGESIVVDALGQRFNYVVENIKVVSPKDVSVINPPDNKGRYLTLMTCVPPGFNTQRLIVLAKLK